MYIPGIIFDPKPEYIASSRRVGNGQILEEWYTNNDAIPPWWDFEKHMLVEFTPGTFSKFCIEHNQRIPDLGCDKCMLESNENETRHRKSSSRN